MTADASAALAEQLTTRFAALDGVRGIFPEHAAAAAILAVVTGAAATDGRVRVDARGPAIRVSARIATSRAVPTRTVIAEAAHAVTAVLGPRPYALDLEFAYID